MTAPLWMPGATVVKATNDGGSMTGSDAYVTWHTFECDYTVGAVVGARSLNANGNSVHLCFNPITGEVAQMLPANRAGRGLLNQAGGVETNRQGRVNIQIEVIARASRPWTQDLTAKGRASLARIIAWLDDLGVPRKAPNGFVGPTSYSASTKRPRSLSAWNGPGGYFCHADVPENDHWDHGAIDMRDLWAATTATPQEEDMAATEADAVVLFTQATPFKNALATNPDTAPRVSAGYLIEGAARIAKDTNADLAALTKAVADLKAQVAALSVAAVPADLAQQVAAELAKRLES